MGLQISCCIRAQATTDGDLQAGRVYHGSARQKECCIVENHLMPDHVHMCIEIPPKHPAASVIGFSKGKSAIAIAWLCGKERNFSGEHFLGTWLRSVDGRIWLEQVREYIREQETAKGT